MTLRAILRHLSVGRQFICPPTNRLSGDEGCSTDRKNCSTGRLSDFASFDRFVMNRCLGGRRNCKAGARRRFHVWPISETRCLVVAALDSDEVSSSIGRTRRSSCRTLPIDRGVGHGDVGCVRWRSRRCTAGPGSPQAHRERRPGVAWPADEGSGRGQPAARSVVCRCAARRAVVMQGRRFGLRRTLREHSWSGCTAGPSRGATLGRLPCVGPSSDGGSRAAVRRPRNCGPCRFGRDCGRSPGALPSTASVRSCRPNWRRRPTCAGAARRSLGSLLNHPSWYRVSPHSASPAISCGLWRWKEAGKSANPGSVQSDQSGPHHCEERVCGHSNDHPRAR